MNVTMMFEQFEMMLQKEAVDSDVVTLINNYVANINELDDVGETLLYKAVSSGRYGIVSHLLNSGAIISQNKQKNEIIDAVLDNKMLELLLKNGGDPDASYEEFAGHWDAAITVAARAGNLNSIRTLLKYNANIDKANYYGDTPLIMAAIYNHYEVIAELLTQMADLTLTNRDGNNALDITLLYYDSGIKSFEAIINSNHPALTLSFLHQTTEKGYQLYQNLVNCDNLELIAEKASMLLRLIDQIGYVIDPLDKVFLHLQIGDYEQSLALLSKAAESDNQDAKILLLIFNEEESMNKKQSVFNRPVIFYHIKDVYDVAGNKITSFVNSTKENIATVEAEKWVINNEEQINYGEGEMITVNNDFFKPGYFSIIAKDDWFSENAEGVRQFNIYQTWFCFWNRPQNGIVFSYSEPIGLENDQNVQFFDEREVRHRMLRYLYQVQLAEDGHAKALYLMGKRFYEGDGVDVNIKYAIYYLKKAIVAGNRLAFELLSQIINENINKPEN